MSDRWIIIDDEVGEVIGRVVGARTMDFAAMCAGAMFPDVSLSVRNWANGSKDQRAAAKRATLVRPENAARLISREVVFPGKRAKE